ncbi:MAG TPA: hypothetical protein VL095_14745 [Flavisolibacter sp.]|nr:hypothetical protein [Flavisolibacter sp.]
MNNARAAQRCVVGAATTQEAMKNSNKARKGEIINVQRNNVQCSILCRDSFRNITDANHPGSATQETIDG